MALTTLQVEVLQLLALRRKRDGESYVAGGVALSEALRAQRVSRDIDLFHDTVEALRASWDADRKTLRAAGFAVKRIREVPSFVEASVEKDDDAVLVQWVRDSAFRFFPLIEDNLLGLTLHPFDLATNKVLAMAGRLEPRDWVDLLGCHSKIQHLGYLTWAACGKDPGFSPEFIVDAAGRQHYSQAEIDLLDFRGHAPSAAKLGAAWKTASAESRDIIERLPEEAVGQCVLNSRGTLYSGTAEDVGADLDSGAVRFHPGTIGGVWPTVSSSDDV